MNEPNFEGRVLVVESDEQWRDLYGQGLEAAGVEGDIVEFGVTAPSRILEGGYGGVITAGFREDWQQLKRAADRVGAATVVISGADWMQERVEAEGALFFDKAQLHDLAPNFMEHVLEQMGNKVKEMQAARTPRD